MTSDERNTQHFSRQIFSNELKAKEYLLHLEKKLNINV